MLEPGKKYNLKIVRRVDFGVYLAENTDTAKEDSVLLPAKQVPDGASVGDEISVFLYRDSQDRLIATVREPALELGGLAVLRVRQVSRIGAFLDWGLEKDLFLPFREQTVHVKENDEVLVSLYTDKSGRLCATMKVYPYLHTRSPYTIGDIVKGRVYECSSNFGVFAAVDDRYSALIPRREAQGTYIPGQILELRVTEVKEDGKLTVSPRQKAYLQMNTDAEQIRSYIESHGRVLPFDDKASPELIGETFGISKAAFKRAVGHLMKEGLAVIEDGKILLSDPDKV